LDAPVRRNPYPPPARKNIAITDTKSRIVNNRLKLSETLAVRHRFDLGF
jgi:hypothetical protein